MAHSPTRMSVFWIDSDGGALATETFLEVFLLDVLELECGREGSCVVCVSGVDLAANGPLVEVTI